MSLLTVLENDWKEIENIFESPIVLAVTEIVATAAGTGSALAIMNKAGGSASDVLTIAKAAYTILTGTSAPTQSQIQAIFASFKSSAVTVSYDTLATEFGTILFGFVQKYQNSNWVKIASDYVYGWEIAAEIQSALTLTAPVAQPATTA